MSSREPLWFCHECQAEMMPLMVPEPHCASCNGTFVEKMENAADDPRDFHNESRGGFDSENAAIDALLNSLGALRPSSRAPTPSPRSSERTGTPRIRFEMRSSGPSGTRTITIGGPNTMDQSPPGGIPTMSEFIGTPGSRLYGNITPQLLFHYISAMMPTQPGEMGMHGFFPSGMTEPEFRGRMGDYVLNQEALDQIITSLMENANSTRPVPATEHIIAELPREVLEIGSKTLEKECAVCKDQFKLDTEDPDEHVVMKLPCTHVFHEGCIVPWLKSSGTCPVCRHALVAQPNQHPPEPTPSGSGSGTRPGSPSVPRRGTGSPSAERSSPTSRLFGMFGGGGDGNSNSRQGSDSRHRHRRTRSGNQPRFPGGWREEGD